VTSCRYPEATHQLLTVGVQNFRQTVTSMFFVEFPEATGKTQSWRQQEAHKSDSKSKNSILSIPAAIRV